MKKINRRRFRLILLAVLSACFGTVAHAENTISIDTEVDGTTFDNGGVPANYVLIISGAANPQLTLKNGATTSPINGPGAVQGLIVGSSGNSGRLLIEGGSIFNNNGTGNLQELYDGLRVRRGNSYLGLSAGSTGVITVTGAGSTFINTNTNESNSNSNLWVGFGGVGKLEVLAGANASNFGATLGYEAGSNGEVLVTGNGSTWTNSNQLAIGNSGTGKLTVGPGGVVSNTVGNIAVSANSVGEATVSGAGATWTNSGILYVGNGGDGTLNVSAGGAVTSANAFVANNAGSKGAVTVSGANSSLSGSDALHVGYRGIGNLTVEAGGAVTNTGISTLGYNTGSNGEVLVTGNGSTWTSNGQMVLGQMGTGKLSITGGGVVHATNTTAINYLGLGNAGSLNNPNAKGEAVVSGAGSTWNVAGELVVGNIGTGKLTVGDGGLVTTRTLIASTSDLFGDGTISTKGAILDGANLAFNATTGTSQSISFGSGGTINLAPDGTGYLGAGRKGTGSLSVAEGVTVASAQGHLGYLAGSNGTATVTGNGSTWNNSAELYVGNAGAGALNVTDGGKVSNTIGYIGNSAGSVGQAVVSGAGSTWTNSEELYVGNNGTGKLTVENGGSVSARTLIASASDLLGNGTISAKGAVLDADLRLDANSGTAPSVSFGSGGSINLTVDGTGYLGAGHKGTGTLAIAEGVTAASAQGIVGNLAGSNGTATVAGAGTTWTNTGALHVGNYGTGKLDVSNGATVSSTNGNIGYRLGSNGEALVSGAGSTWNNSENLTVGGGGGGTSLVPALGKLTIEAGGKVTSVQGVIASTSGNGEALVTGAGSTWANSGDLIVGNWDRGSSKLTIADGGSVTNTNGLINNQTHHVQGFGEVLVTGIGSNWVNSGVLSVGDLGTGSLVIENGATVTSATSFVGASAYAASHSTALVTGAGSTWTTAGDFVVGGRGLIVQSGGNGTLTVADGGKLVVGGTLATHSGDVVNLGVGGTIEVNNFRVSQNNRSGAFNWTGGTLDVDGIVGAGRVTSNVLTVPELGKLTGTGTVVGELVLPSSAGGQTTVVAGTLENRGIVAPGNSPGTLSVFGDYVQLDTGILEIELGGLTAGTLYDQLVVSGNAALNGSLVVSLYDGFTLEDGQVFTILTASNITGQFAGLDDRAIVDTFGGFDLVVNYNATSVQLSAISAVPEPTSLALVATVMAGAVGYRRRRKKVITAAGPMA